MPALQNSNLGLWAFLGLNLYFVGSWHLDLNKLIFYSVKSL